MGLGFRVQGLGFRAWGLGFGVEGSAVPGCKRVEGLDELQNLRAS